jgi:AP-3 complex subunit beta
VKLQIINLAAKLQLTNPSQTTLLCQYILNLAKYDQSYDIRDRARFIRHLLFPENPESKLSKYARKILLSSKPAPVLQSKFKGRTFICTFFFVYRTYKDQAIDRLFHKRF